MRPVLKAQSQCRTTIETLSEMKNPKPVAFVQQANIANEPQQVNNAPMEQVERQWLETPIAVASAQCCAPWQHCSSSSVERWASMVMSRRFRSWGEA